MVRRLLLLNGLAAITAVAHHAIHWVLIAMVWWTDQYRPVSIPNYEMVGGWGYYGLRIVDQLALLGVPSFLFVSGFFIANSTSKSQKTIGWRIVLNRLRVILVPYIVWVSIILLGDFIEGEKYTAIGILKLFLTGRVAPPYYYVPLLIQLFLLSFLLVPLARERRKLLLWIAFLLQIPVTVLTYLRLLGVDLSCFETISLAFTDWHLPGYLMWLVLGMVAGFHKLDFKNFITRYRSGIIIGLVATFFGGIIEWAYLRQLIDREWLSPQITLVDKIYTIVFLLYFFSIENIKIPFSKEIEKIGIMSYGIYLIHVPVLELTSRVIFHLTPAFLGYYGWLFLLLAVVGVAIPVTLMKLVNWTPARIFYEYLFG